MAGLWSAEEEFHVKEFLGLAAVGNPEKIKLALENLASELNINEFMFTIDVYDPEQRKHALELLAKIKGD
jgi:hypothetical protein